VPNAAERAGEPYFPMTSIDLKPRAGTLSRIRVNGIDRPVAIEPDRSLLVALREELGLVGTKYGCGEGECGACKVLLDGVAVRACITPLGEAIGRSVTTIEGLAMGDRLHPVQQAFLDAGAFQCGFCTPGMIVSVTSLLSRTPRPSEEEIVAALNGNVCRCGGYLRILDAIRRVSVGSSAVEKGSP